MRRGNGCRQSDTGKRWWHQRCVNEPLLTKTSPASSLKPPKRRIYFNQNTFVILRSQKKHFKSHLSVQTSFLQAVADMKTDFGWRIPLKSLRAVSSSPLWNIGSTTDPLTNIQRSERWHKQEREREKEVPFLLHEEDFQTRCSVLVSARVQSHKKSLSSMSDVWFWLRPVGIKLNSGLWTSGSSPELLPTMTTETEELKTLADLKTSPSSLRLSLIRSDRRQKDWRKPNCLLLLSNFSLHPSIRPSVCSLSLCPCLGLCCTVGGQQGALLGRLAQLYLLLDDPSRVVDERVDQTGHCGRTSRREEHKTQVRFPSLHPQLHFTTWHSDVEGLTCEHTSDNGTHSC